jgi:hypothetical protein
MQIKASDVVDANAPAGASPSSITPTTVCAANNDSTTSQNSRSDGAEDVARSAEFDRAWEFWTQHDALERKIAEWELVPVSSATDMANKEDRQRLVREELTELEERYQDIYRGQTNPVEPAPIPAKERQTRSNAVRVEIEKTILALGPEWTSYQVINEITRRAGQVGCTFTEVAVDGLIWKNASGTLNKVTFRNLKKRIAALPKKTR